MSVSLRLPPELNQRLSHLAEQTGRSKTFYMLEAIKQHLDDLEDVYLAERELEAVRAGKSKAVPLEEVMKQYGVLRPNPRKFQNALFLTVPTAFDHLGAARHQAQDAGKGFAA